MSIGQRIKATRKAAGISQATLSERVGIRQPTLSDLENDMSKGTTKLASIAKALNVRPYWLETGKGPMSAEALEDPLDPTVSADAMRVAKAFDLLQSDAQREAVLTQLRAFGVLE